MDIINPSKGGILILWFEVFSVFFGIGFSFRAGIYCVVLLVVFWPDIREKIARISNVEVTADEVVYVICANIPKKIEEIVADIEEQKKLLPPIFVSQAKVLHHVEHLIAVGTVGCRDNYVREPFVRGVDGFSEYYRVC